MNAEARRPGGTAMTTTAIEPDTTTPIHRVVVGIDGSPAAERALEWAAAEAARFGAVLEGHTSHELGYVFISREEVQMAMKTVIDEATAHVADIVPGVIFKGVAHE